MLFLSLENGDACVISLPDGSTGHVIRTSNGIAFRFEDDVRITRSELLFGFSDSLPTDAKWASTSATIPAVVQPGLDAYWDAMIVRAANLYDVRKPHECKTSWFFRPWPKDPRITQFAVGVESEDEDGIITYAWEINPSKRPRRIG